MVKNIRIFITAAALLLIGLACSTFSGSNANNSPSNTGGNEAQTPKPTNTPSATEPDKTASQEEFLIDGLPPVSYEEILEAGVLAGEWTKAEGFELLLKYFLGEVSQEEVPGAADVITKTATGVIRELQDYLETQDLDADTRAKLEVLFRRIIPPQEILEQISELKGSARLNKLGSTNPLPEQQTEASCNEISNLGYDTDDLQLMAGCYFYQEQTFQSSTFRIYYPFWWHGEGPYSPIIENTFTAMMDSANTYAALDSLVIGDINLIFPIENSGSTLGAQAYFDLQNQACPLTMYPLAYEESGPAKFKQVVAHEMFHCVQDYSFPNTSPYGTHAWWLEGTADYFSNVVYPQTNLEWEFLGSFDQKSTNKPIFALDYENFVFFQFMGNRYSDQTLVNILQDISAAGSQSGQQTALSNVPDIESNFNLFVVEFLSSGVPDSGGGGITVAQPATSDTKTVSDKGEHPFSTAPFVATRYKVDYKKEKRYLQSALPGDNGSFSGAEHSGFKNIGNWSNLPPEVRSYCKEDLPYLFAVTTTGSGSYEFIADVTLAQKAVCDPCLLGVWAVDNDSFEDYILRIAEKAGPVEGGGEFIMEVEGFNYLEFKDNATLVTRRDAFAISTGVSTYDVTFVTTIDSQGGGTYSADGEKIQVFQLTDYVNSINASMNGLPFSINQTPGASTYSIFGVSSTGPGYNQEDGPQDAHGTYVCDQETLTVNQPEYGDILFNRVEKIIPTPVPTPGP